MCVNAEILANRDYWQQFEHDDWKLLAFTGLDSATFQNEQGRTVQVTGDFMAFFGLEECSYCKQMGRTRLGWHCIHCGGC